MSAISHFISKSIRNVEIDEFLMKELERAGYGGVEITRTPLGTHVTVYAAKPGIVIGRRGVNIRDLTRVLEEKFGLTAPQIAVAEIEVPELNPFIMASRVASALQRGVHFRRAGFWSLNRIMGAGALGAQITIRGKLRTRRHRYEKYCSGYLPSTGDAAARNVKTAVVHVKLKSGVFGIEVKILLPDAEFPDLIQIKPPTKEEVEVEAGGSSPEEEA